MCSKCCKNHGCGQKKPALLYLALGPVRNAAISSVVPTKFAAEPTKKDEFLEDKFRNLNFLPSTKKTTDYKYLIFFLKF